MYQVIGYNTDKDSRIPTLLGEAEDLDGAAEIASNHQTKFDSIEYETESQTFLWDHQGFDWGWIPLD